MIINELGIVPDSNVFASSIKAPNAITITGPDKRTTITIALK